MSRDEHRRIWDQVDERLRQNPEAARAEYARQLANFGFTAREIENMVREWWEKMSNHSNST